MSDALKDIRDEMLEYPYGMAEKYLALQEQVAEEQKFKQEYYDGGQILVEENAKLKRKLKKLGYAV